MSETLLKVWREIGLHDDMDAVTAAVSHLLQQSIQLIGIEILEFDKRRMGLRPIAAQPRDPARGSIALNGEQFGALLDWFDHERSTVASAAGPWPTPLAPLEEIHATRDAMLGVIARDQDGAPRAIALLLAPAGTLQPARVRLLEKLFEPLAVALAQHERREELGKLRAAASKRRTVGAIDRDLTADGIVGSDSGLRPVMIRIDQVAPSDSSVLLLGETGSGKEVIARAIHDRSLRVAAPFIRVNCGALPPELIDSELFGHEKGSFTGAAARRKGWFEQADGGTLFLDEVGELPPAVQVRLLRVLQDGSLTRVGGEEAIHVDVRVIAATHRDLAAMVQEGAFREDLWYRIAVFPILIPPLRERRQDIPELARHFARRASAKIGLHPQMPTDADLALLQDYAWPGNVREMASVIERAAILGEGQRLDVAAALGLSVPARSGSGQRIAGTSQRFPTLDQVIVDHIQAALQLTHGRVEGRKGAAQLLGINPHTLRSRMRKFGIDPAPWRKEGED
ncbi:MAG: sigma-54 dependent transcriptional regulator [Gammaproteobacteria bacterium]|jgi:transcriptional regulator with GAF, ATPase, and Fis domain|nr:sigma-54 dependent transcriptional regulator [Gammaproteobacteria bacterium]